MATQLAEQIEEPLVVADEGGEQQTQERDFEAEARAQGWRPPEEWPEDKPGKPAKFKSAEEFVQAREKNLGYEVDFLKKKMERRDREHRELVSRLMKSEQTAYENAMRDIEAKRLDAVRIGDEEAFLALDKKADKLRETVAAAVALEHSEDPQEAYDAFRETNAWYDRANLASASDIEVEARLYADRLADKYVRAGLQQEVTPTEFFARVASETEAKFPLLKARKSRDKPVSPVAGVTNGAPTRGAKIGANLPPEAKEHAERYMRQGLYRDCKTKAEAYDRFAKDYSWPAN